MILSNGFVVLMICHTDLVRFCFKVVEAVSLCGESDVMVFVSLLLLFFLKIMF